MRTSTKIISLGAVGLGGAALLAVAVSLRGTPAPPPEPPHKPVPLARLADEGTLTRSSPEDDFLRSAGAGKGTAPPISASERVKEMKRVLAGLRGQFASMKRLAEFYKKTDPARYASEMSALKPELTRLLQESRGLLDGSMEAAAELFAAIREESDPVLKERLTFLLRYVEAHPAATFAAGLSESTTAADRRAALAVLPELRTSESATALIRRAAGDTDLDLRQHAIVGLGKLLAAPSSEAAAYQASVMTAIRSYTQPLNEPQIRSAAWDAMSSLRSLSPDDQKLIRDALHTEKDRTVLKSVENAYRRQTARSAAQSSKPEAPPK